MKSLKILMSIILVAILLVGLGYRVIQWDAFIKNSGGMWGTYIAKIRSDIQSLDPVDYEV